MEDVIQRIISLEETANEIIASALEEERAIISKGEAEVLAMAAHILEMSDAKVGQLKGSTQYESDDRIIRICQDTAMKMRMMEEHAEQDQIRWEEEVFNRIIGR
jgi:hypothetical protein